MITGKRNWGWVLTGSSRRLLFLVFGLVLLLVNTSVADLDEKEIEGLKIAALQRELMPAENTQLRGVFMTRNKKGQRQKIPFTMEVEVGADSWASNYRTYTNDGELLQELSILRAPGLPTRYLYSDHAGTPSSVKSVSRRNAVQTTFSGTDFTLSDLGMEFFYWPAQKALQVKTPRKKGFHCDVLESLNPDDDEKHFCRVISWIDKKSGALIYAEAFGENGKRTKVFEPGGARRVDGIWRVKKLTLRNLVRDSRTVIEFEYKKD
ncbi:MAG TPA: outer membrane lipoprotein-sorting protein [Verrucomicrobiales bacterium]|jgi:hypothetical protein|nr:outer membrane lipoprotein-sorting protein [Verrucomicrobiales bacterium]HIL71755.1 outer membrane lipoprotein-sorting protein [Verrucomicrobiota bacterium]